MSQPGISYTFQSISASTLTNLQCGIVKNQDQDMFWRAARMAVVFSLTKKNNAPFTRHPENWNTMANSCPGIKKDIPEKLLEKIVRLEKKKLDLSIKKLDIQINPL